MRSADDILVRDEGPEDAAAIAAVVAAAFGRDDEASLVEALRAEGSAVASLVAVAGDGGIVGHVLFSALGIDDRAGLAAGAALAPLAVRPERQRSGIGGALVRAGLDACRGRGIDVVVVLGHPAYYPRFGFAPAAALGLRDPSDAGPAFMALPLRPTRWRAPATVRYAPAFGLPG